MQISPTDDGESMPTRQKWSCMSNGSGQRQRRWPRKYEAYFCQRDPDTREIVPLPDRIFHPASYFMTMWGGCMAFCIVLCLVIVPFQAGFNYKASIDGPGVRPLWAVILPAMDVLFIADIFINFRCAFFEDGELIIDRRRIRLSYLRGWAPIDIAAVVPSVIDWISALMDDGGAGSGLAVLRNLKMLRLVRLMKLLRLMKLGKMFAALEDMSMEMKMIVRLVKICTAVFGCTHLMACGWWALGSYHGSKSSRLPDTADNWLTAYYGSDEWAEFDVISQYVGAVYFAFVTVTTVGYGDVTPQNDFERVYCILASFLGTTVFAYIMGEVTALVTAGHAEDVAFSEKMQSVDAFMAFKKFPKPLRKAVRDWYFKVYRLNVTFSERDILQELPPELQEECAMFLKTDVISKVPFLRGASRPALTMLCTRMYPRVVGAGFNVISRGDTVDNCFIIENGEVTVERHDGNAPTTLRDGFFFGEFALLHGGWMSDITVRATRTTDLVVLPKQAMDEVLERYPAFAVHVHEKLLNPSAAFAPERVSFLIKKKNKKSEQSEPDNLVSPRFSPLQRGIAIATMVRFFRRAMALPAKERAVRKRTLKARRESIADV